MKARNSSVARVWTLSNESKRSTTSLGVSRNWRNPLLPVKRVDTVAPGLRWTRPRHEGKLRSLYVHTSNQLQRYRSGHPLYTRSADGFSLHRSGVMSKSGANLKWTKSLMKRSLSASAAATKLVAEAEKKKRDKEEAVIRAKAKARDDRRALLNFGKQAQLRSETVGPSSVSSIVLPGTGAATYVRKGFGNQLVRDSRTMARAMSRSGANFKWTKYVMKRSLSASWAGTKIVAEAQRRKRDKKEAVRLAKAKARYVRRALQDSGKQAQLRSVAVGPSSVSSLGPLGTGGAIYVRKGFGNQLVRDSRTIARAFASEKVRWSLKNARWRRAKKQTFCVYYTRFGVCKRGDGKCLYIHDPDKVAVCSKFLRGSCSDPACHLTHKVIPERMSDCSYFLEGLCTNESCPYRHVNVDPNAPICDSFLQGYCADGDMCNKKHTYVCPEYALTGKCSAITCKLRHVKKATPSSREGLKREGRYFTPSATADEDSQAQFVFAAKVADDKVAEAIDYGAEFISVDV